MNTTHKTNADYARELTLRVRERARDASPSRKRLERMHRQLTRRAISSYEGYTLNRPMAGDVLMHMRRADGGRDTIRVRFDGSLRRTGTKYITVEELFAQEACNE